MNPASPLWGLVLAGGRSRRFGADKAAVDVDGQSLLARSVALLVPHVAGVRVSIQADQMDDPLRARFEFLVDETGDTGPAAGLLAAQAFRPDAAWLVIACDLPALDARTLAQLCAARDPDRAATVFLSPADGLPEPLCAIWEPDTLAVLRRRVTEQQLRSPRELLLDADVRLIEPEHPGALMNMNRPVQLDSLRKLNQERSG